MSEANHWLCHKVVEHIKRCGELLFDTADLEEDFEKVLSEYGWFLNLQEEEKGIIYHDLYEIALRVEASEMSRSIDVEDFLFELARDNKMLIKNPMPAKA
ncbi:MAG: hypothetical protein ABII22_04580 [Candidatus Micrarchaeota archaeon]